MRITCKCGQPIEYGDEVAGKVLVCPSCQKDLPLPRSLKAQIIRPLKWFAFFFAVMFGINLVGIMMHKADSANPSLSPEQLSIRSNGFTMTVANNSGRHLTGVLQIGGDFKHEFDLAHGKATTLALNNFADSKGNRFQPQQKKIGEIIITGQQFGWTRFEMQ